MENSTYIKFGIALLFIIIYGCASLLVFLDPRKMNKTKNIDIEKEILNISDNQTNINKFTVQQPTGHGRENIRMKRKNADKNKKQLKKEVL